MSISLERKQGDTDMHESAAEIPSCSTVSNEIAASAQVGEQDLFEEEDTGPSDFGKGMLSNSIPSILQRILRVEHESVKKPTDLLFLAIHAVMQETGFVVTNAVEEGHTLPRGWSNSGFANVSYTLKNMPDAEKGVHSVELKYLTLGSNLVVYGSISDSGCSSRKLSLLSSKHIIDNVISRDDTISSFCDVFELWKCAKDELSLPLLTNLCEMAGLPVPSSLLVIPTELKMKILECLPALDLVKVGCTCSELRHLCANDELWKRLFHYDFGNPSGAQQLASFRGWKSAYAVRFLDKKRSFERRSRVMRPFYGIASRSRFPRIIGGDYDVYPLIGNEPFGAGGSFGGFGGGLGGFRGGLGGFRGAQGSLGNLHGRLRDEEPWNYW
ncbi:hypothetical protein KP509_1Z000600 [Ceratopteris richardii]|nr:hypothetical protein KP509_1Z000600 [Ceratopteris richardii]